MGTIYLFTLTTIWSASEIYKKGDFRNGSSFNVISPKSQKKLLTNQSFSDNIGMSKDKA